MALKPRQSFFRRFEKIADALHPPAAKASPFTEKELNTVLEELKSDFRTNLTKASNARLHGKRRRPHPAAGAQDLSPRFVPRSTAAATHATQATQTAPALASTKQTARDFPLLDLASSAPVRNADSTTTASFVNSAAAAPELETAGTDSHVASVVGVLSSNKVLRSTLEESLRQRQGERQRRSEWHRHINDFSNRLDKEREALSRRIVEWRKESGIADLGLCEDGRSWTWQPKLRINGKSDQDAFSQQLHKDVKVLLIDGVMSLRKAHDMPFHEIVSNTNAMKAIAKVLRLKTTDPLASVKVMRDWYFEEGVFSHASVQNWSMLFYHISLNPEKVPSFETRYRNSIYLTNRLMNTMAIWDEIPLEQPFPEDYVQPSVLCEDGVVRWPFLRASVYLAREMEWLKRELSRKHESKEEEQSLTWTMDPEKLLRLLIPSKAVDIALE